MLDNDLKLAIKEIKIAENNFNNAKGEEEINWAINRLMEAEERLNQIIAKKKGKKNV